MLPIMVTTTQTWGAVSLYSVQFVQVIRYPPHLMNEEILYATPYAWDNPSLEEAHRQANRSLSKRPFVGSGFLALRETAFGSNGSNNNGTPQAEPMDGLSQDLLRYLLQQHGVEIPADNDDSKQVPVNTKYGSTVSTPIEGNKIPVSPGTAATKVLEEARTGKFSLFLSILKIIEECQTGPVPTKTLIKQCCMSLRPAEVPASLDAKEMVLAALHFLSSKFTANSEELQSLPLIRPVQALGDLEKRNWIRVGDWGVDDIRDKVLRLEKVFVSSPSSWRWLKRETISPRLSKKDEDAFFLKGTVPTKALAKKVSRETTTRKRKAPAQTSPPPPSSTTVSSPVVTTEISTSIADTSFDADEFPSIP